MSEDPKMISPMLDKFIMGSAISAHHGICCYPAIENESGDRYIVKIISVPATATQIDALLLTGAFPDKEAALAYFKDIADGLMAEIDTLEKLTELEGFIAYNDSQIVPKESGEGFDIYLLSTYKRTLQKHFTRHSFTHLDALNLGLDLCAALSVCRRLGYLYVDLKPSNVFVNDQRLFRIGDLGFVRIDSLKYASLPEKYISTYTPPEIRDAFSALNTTMDVYAAGLILYQAYNNGELPFNTLVQPGNDLPAPLYADYEMSEIILKACAPNPEDRWQDPTQMGQAIISYMQRNGASDTPIVPIPAPEPINEATVAAKLPQDAVTEPEAVWESESAAEVTNEEAAQEDAAVADQTAEDIEIDPDTNTASDPDVVIADDAVEETVCENGGDMQQNISIESDAPHISEVDNAQDDTSGELEILEEALFPNEEDAEEFDPNGEITVTEEVSDILNQADELTAMDVPEPVFVPEYVEVPVPEIVAAAEEPESDEPVDNAETGEVESAGQSLAGEESDPDAQEEEIPDTQPVKRRWLRNTLIAVAALALLIVGFFFYTNYYLLPIEIGTVEGNMDTLTVYVSSEIDESLLTVVCSDTYGNKLYAPVIDGKADFTGLVPNTAYTVKVTAKGFHRLTGNAKTAYSTPVQSNVMQFDAITGTTNDSAILSFTVEGPNVDNWTVYYSAEGEEEKSATFSSQMVTLTGLTVGKEYTFRLVPEGDLYVAGLSTIQFTPRDLIFAENLRVTSCVNNSLSVAWDVPENETVTNWSVHCFNDTYNQTIITADTSVSFTDLDHTAGYTIEVKAAGMSVGQSATVPANSVTAENFNIDTTDPTKLIFSWVTSQKVPDDELLLRYSIVGIDNFETIPCSTNSATISPVIPNATYKVQLEDMNGNVLLGSENVIKTGNPVAFTKEFSNFTAQTSDLQFTMVKTPNHAGWGRLDLNAGDYRNTFSVGEPTGFLVRFDKLYNAPDEEVTILLVTRDQQGQLIHSCIQVNTWKKMWPLTYYKLNTLTMPATAGEYTMEIYFNGMLVHEQPFTIK